MDSPKNSQAELKEWVQFIQSQSHVLKRYPFLLFQQAANQPDRSPLAKSALSRLRDGLEKRPWHEWVNKPQYRDPCLMVLAGHQYGLRTCAFRWMANSSSPALSEADHTCSYSPDGRWITALDGNRLRNLKTWDARSGVAVGLLAGSSPLRAWSYSPDGEHIVSASMDGTVRIWDASVNEQLACFPAATDVAVLVVGRLDHLIAVGDRGGRVYLLRLQNHPVACPLTTLIYLFHPARASWEEHATGRCDWCGKRLTPAESVISAIQEINADAGLSPGQSPCAALPDDAWNDARLKSECPHCHQPLRFNPFIVDNRDRY